MTTAAGPGPSAAGRRVSRALLTALLFAAAHATAADLSLDARRADFDELWKTVNDQYVYLDGKRAAWASARERYAAHIEQATTADAWAALLEDALDELTDFHVGSNPGSAHTWLAVPTSADLWAIPDGDLARVVAVRAGGDAERAGVAVGDIIVTIGGVPVGAAIAQRLPAPVDATQSGAREWALLSLVTGRRGVTRTFVLRRPGEAARTVVLPAQRRIDRPPTPVSWSRLPENVGVIRINNSLGEMATVAAFDAALADLRDTRALILDLRDTPSGGNSAVALGVMGRLVAVRTPYQRHRIAHYGEPDIERNWQEEVAPRGPFTYRAPLVVMVDHWTGSMGEGMAIGLDGMRRGTVVGTTMGQLAGATEEFTLPRTGMRIALPTEELFHVDGTPRHRWMPPVIVAPVAGPAGTDPTLDRARALLANSGVVP